MSWNWGQYAFLPAFAAPGPGKPQSFHIFTDSCFSLPSWKILTNNTTATVDLESPFLILIQFQIRIEDCLSRKISSMNPVLKWLQNLQYSKGFIHKYTLKKEKEKSFHLSSFLVLMGFPCCGFIVWCRLFVAERRWWQTYTCCIKPDGLTFASSSIPMNVNLTNSQRNHN